MKKLFLTFLCFIFIPSAHAATSVPFTITMSEAVNVTGNPRIAVDVGGVTRYATYASGTGTSALTFTYDMVSGDVDMDGVNLSSPIDLNGGTITDLSGNPASLTFTPPDTSGVLINAAVPSGYTAGFIDDTVTNVNKTNFGFNLNYNKANKTIHYSIASSGGGSPITGTATTTGAVQNITGMNVSALPDGKLTLSVYLTDAIGGTGATVTDTAPMAVLDSSLVGHWTFDANDISGTTAYDRSGNDLNGVLQGTPTASSGIVGQSLLFDGLNSGDNVSIGSSSSLNPPYFTITAWIYAGVLSGPYNYIYSSARDCCGSYNGKEFRVTSNRVVGAIWNGSNANRTSSTTLSDNSGWHYVSYSYDGSVIKLYIDGIFDSQNNTTLGVGSPASYGNYIGAMGYGPSVYIFNGKIDDVRIYNRALTPAEITTLYNSGF